MTGPSSTTTTTETLVVDTLPEKERPEGPLPEPSVRSKNSRTISSSSSSSSSGSSSNGSTANDSTNNSNASDSIPWKVRPRHTQPRRQPPYFEMQTMTLDLVRDICLYIRAGDTVMTPYGLGTLVQNRSPVVSPKNNSNSDTDNAENSNESMVIRLNFGGMLYVKHPDSIHKVLSTDDYKNAMEHLDQIRGFHLASMCEEFKCAPPKDGVCVACTFDRPEYEGDATKRRKSRWKQLVPKKGGSHNPRKAVYECDVCGQGICSFHRLCGANEYFTICVDCSHDLNQAEHQLNPHHPDLNKNLHRLLHYYTRMSIRLAFICPHLGKVAHRLTSEQRRDSQISLGTSGLGFVGAALGVAGAAAILTPAGPAILIAAMATSATSGTIQAGHMGYNKFLSNKDAHQIADRVLGWHGLCLGILRTLEQLRKDLLAENLSGGKEFSKVRATSVNKQGVDIWNALAVGSFSTTRQAMTGVGVSSALGASYSQAISTGLQTIPVVGAAFSVGCMAMDATNIYGSLQSLVKPSEITVALQHVEHSFIHSIPNLGYVQATVQVIADAVEELNNRWEQQRKEQDEFYQQQPQNAFQVVDSLFVEEEDDVKSVD